MKRPLNWNLDWMFCEGFSEDRIATGNTEGMQPIHLPHTVRELPYNNFSHDLTAMYSTYAKRFTVSAEMRKKRTIVEFEGVMAYFDLYVNGVKAGSHKGGYSRSRFEITSLLKEGENLMMLMVDSHERDDIPPFGYIVDYLTYGGIYRDVNLYVLEDAFVSDVSFCYEMSGERSAICRPKLCLDNRGIAGMRTVTVRLTGPDGRTAAEERQQIQLEEGVSSVLLEPFPVEGIVRWSPSDPALYQVQIGLGDGDETVFRTGFRTVEALPDGLRINGEKITVAGMDRHQSYPYVGYAMGRRAQRADADTLKQWGLNAVRTSHYMQSKYFLERCDELGLLVFEEIPGWGHIGGAEFKKVVLQDVRDMITTDFNHPSIFLWGVRINESQDDDELYAETNRIAHELDPSRPTGGVRFLKNSHLLEDVYTYNDFCHADDVGLDHVLLGQHEVTGLTKAVPYLVSEYMGHTYPTKRFDNEVLLDQHARRHADILERTLTRKDSLGSFGWCAFDYNTHGDCGSGDKICYHGILDMFRIPKYAAWIYRSQKEPDEEIILQPLTNFARGEKACNGITPFLVATNCDYIEVFMYGQSIGYYYPSDKWAGLPHAPVEVVFNDAGMWGVPWQDGRVVGYVDGKAAAEYLYARDTYLASLSVTPETDVLCCDTVDTCRFEVSLLDQLGHLCTFANAAVAVETEGNIEVIGPHILVPVGGAIAFWVKTVPAAEESTAKVRVRLLESGLEEQIFTLKLKKRFEG